MLIVCVRVCVRVYVGEGGGLVVVRLCPLYTRRLLQRDLRWHAAPRPRPAQTAAHPCHVHPAGGDVLKSRAHLSLLLAGVVYVQSAAFVIESGERRSGTLVQRMNVEVR